MSKYNPKNALEALTYQLEDDVKVLRCLAALKDKKSFAQGLKVMSAHIKGTLALNEKRRRQNA